VGGPPTDILTFVAWDMDRELREMFGLVRSRLEDIAEGLEADDEWPAPGAAPLPAGGATPAAIRDQPPRAAPVPPIDHPYIPAEPLAVAQSPRQQLPSGRRGFIACRIDRRRVSK
jgi:hypothetical protein